MYDGKDPICLRRVEATSRMTEMPRVAVGGQSKLGARAGCCPVSCSPSTTALRVLLWKFGYNEPRCLPTSPTGSSRRL